MGTPAVRQGDVNSAGGVATTGASTVFVNGRPLVFPGVGVTPHPCCGAPGCGIHCAASTSGGSPTVFVEGKPVIRVGDSDTCGHARSQGSPNVNVA